jgi:hypothetical protein
MNSRRRMQLPTAKAWAYADNALQWGITALFCDARNGVSVKFAVQKFQVAGVA